MKKLIVCIGLLFVCLSAEAQLTIGSMQPGATLAPPPPYTAVDFSHPASAAGTVSTATVRWFGGGCGAAFKLKFLHVTNGMSNYTVYDQRGPFNVTNSGASTFALAPPVTVAAGDLIAITQTAPLSCGSIGLSYGPASAVAMVFNGEIPAFGTFSGRWLQGMVVSVRASSDTNIVEGVIAGTGSAAGSFGSFFRTAVQLTNLDSQHATGKLVFHPAGRSASASDPSIGYDIKSFGTVSFADVVQAMGTSGLGSIDVVSTSGWRPLVDVRVFNDQGDAGTSGFAEPIVTSDDYLVAFNRVFFPMPADLTNFRMNVGVRTLDAGATLLISSGGSGGIVQVTKTLPANYFEQTGLAQFINNTPFVNGVVTIDVTAGSAVIYTSTTDNRTNDSSIRFVSR